MTGKSLARLLGFLIVLAMLAPILGIAWLTISPPEISDSANDGLMSFLMTTVLPYQFGQTLGLMLGVAVVTLLAGVPAAWFVTFIDFPGRRHLQWLLLLPLAMPTYIAAYVFAEFLDKAGPFYQLWVSIFGNHAWYPSLNSLGGAIFTLSAVLYPYVYMSARTGFINQSAELMQAGRVLGASQWMSFRQIAIPLSRPMIIVGVALALMECLNDIGAVEHLGVKTLTVGVYETWLSRGSLEGAARIAMLLLALMALLLLVERYLRAGGIEQKSKHNLAPILHKPTPLMQGVILIISSLPFLIGFVLPVVLLIIFSLGRFENADGLFSAATRSIVLASATAIIVVGIGFFLAFLTRINTPGWLNKSIQTASLGYAIPGTVLGLGVLIVLSQFDNFSSQLLNLSFLPILSGSLFALIFAYSLRFLSISFGTFEAELSRIPKTTDMAASTLGARTFQLLRLVHLPMLRPALITASVLIFVDTMKELPATLILRPFNFETLATQIYNYASVGQIEDAALPALIIVGVGIIPVFVATRKLHKL